MTLPTYSRVAPSVFVSDHKRALDFYVNVLGFTLDNIDDPPFRAVVTQRAAVLHLDLVPGKAGSGSIHMLVDDLDLVFTRVQSAGAKVLQPPTSQPWGLRELTVADPDGNVLEIATPVR
jgi:uncharacterized glyoxalase superfamily protein PhnB